jgi:hypothetical protein
VQARASWRLDDTAGIGEVAPERLVFLDESAVLTNMARRYGRSPCGQRAYAKVPFGHWKRLSVLSALDSEGFLATMSIHAATAATPLPPIWSRCYCRCCMNTSPMRCW